MNRFFPMSSNQAALLNAGLDLFEASMDAASRAIEARKKRRAPKRGLTLMPGPDTPLWNELVRQVNPLLKKRGSKAQLARLLGLHRQRLQTCLKAGCGCFDAERTLLLLAWLRARRRGREIIA